MVVKAYFLLREDLNMSPAKMSIQVGHGTDFIWSGAKDNHAKWVQESYRRKILLKISSLEKLNNLKKTLDDNNISYHEIIDEGFTEFKGRTLTGIVIYPVEESLLPKSLTRLRLWV